MPRTGRATQTRTNMNPPQSQPGPITKALSSYPAANARETPALPMRGPSRQEFGDPYGPLKMKSCRHLWAGS
jgi:hypothetical protein